MNTKFLIIISILALALVSCKENSKTNEDANPAQILDPQIEAEHLETDFRTWWTYHSNHIELASDFTSRDENSTTLDKEQTLRKLTSGNFIPLKLKSEQEEPLYKLYKLSDTVNQSIKNTIKSQASTILKHYSMEGQSFPDFDFEDLEGNRYTNENIKGKDVFIKTWFINCKACIEEFPELNEFIEETKNENILFISLALDTEAQLEKFLQNTEFKYSVIPSQSDFINNILQAQIYPTHYLLDKKGVIRKVENQSSRIIEYYKSTRHENKTTQTPTPPKN